MTNDGDDEPDVPVVCSVCDTTSRVPLSDVPEAIDRHNDRAHDGEEIAEVDPALKNRLADLVAEDLNLFEDVDE